MTEEQEKYLNEILTALAESEKQPPLEVPQKVLVNDKDFISWLKSLQINTEN